MLSKICIALAVIAVAVHALPEPPRFRSQRFRQQPFAFARQEAPYPASSGGNPATAYGPPPTPAPSPKPEYGAPPKPEYGPPPPAVAGSDAESVDTTLASPDNTDSTEVVANSGRFRAQKLQLQHGDHQLQPLEQGSYFIQLPNGQIQRVTYESASDPVDHSVSAQLQFQPVASLAPQQAPLFQPLVFNPYVTQLVK